jgi:uncharacterized membrane protein required for colicin V production
MAFLTSINVFDLLVIFFLMAMFILGFIQGTIRRLLGLGSIIFSFLLAAQLRGPFGSFLAENWTHLPASYDFMVAFALVFIVATIVFTIIIQAFYKGMPLFADNTIIDEVLGGLLGIIQGVVILAAMIMILDSHFARGFGPAAGEFGWFRLLFDAYDGSGTAVLFRDILIPAFLTIAGAMVPEDVRAVFQPGA